MGNEPFLEVDPCWFNLNFAYSDQLLIGFL